MERDRGRFGIAEVSVPYWSMFIVSSVVAFGRITQRLSLRIVRVPRTVTLFYIRILYIAGTVTRAHEFFVDRSAREREQYLEIAIFVVPSKSPLRFS